MKATKNLQNMISAVLQKACYFCFIVVVVLTIIWMVTKK